jgi:hypothetical protein
MAAARALAEAMQEFAAAVPVPDAVAAAAYVIARAGSFGVRLSPHRGGRIRLDAPAPPPPYIIEELRRCREAVRVLLGAKPTAPADPAPPGRRLWRIRGGGP